MVKADALVAVFIVVLGEGVKTRSHPPALLSEIVTSAAHTAEPKVSDIKRPIESIMRFVIIKFPSLISFLN